MAAKSMTNPHNDNTNRADPPGWRWHNDGTNREDPYNGIKRCTKRSVVLVLLFSIIITGLLSSISSTAVLQISADMVFDRLLAIANEPVDVATESVDVRRGSTQPQQQQQEQQRQSLAEMPALAAEAMRFLTAREQSYIAEGRSTHWKMRGTGYLYERQNLLLLATLPEPNITLNNGRVSDSDTTTTRAVVRIDDIMPFLDDDERRRSRIDYHTNYCDKLTVWVRVNGPEIFAGSAVAVVDDYNAKPNTKRPSCHWEFPVDLTVPGTYEVDAKVLVWNGKAPFHAVTKTGKKAMRCRYLDGGAEKITDSEIISHTVDDLVSGGFIGFKFYNPKGSCCEVCSRTPGCLYWATPPKDLQIASVKRNGCELFFEHHASDYIPSELASGILASKLDNTDTSRRRVVRTLTEAADVDASDFDAADFDAADFDAAGFDDADFDAADFDDSEYLHWRRLNVDRSHGIRADESPDELPYFLGCGWSFWFTLDFPCLSGGLDDRVVTRGNRRSFSVVRDPTESDTTTKAPAPRPLPLCTADNEVAAANPSRRAGRWVRLPWPDDCGEPVFESPNSQTKFDILQFDPERPRCWHRDDLKRIGQLCIEMNCKEIRKESRWISTVHKETQFYGYWQKDGCDYLEFTTRELQECITERKISSIEVVGASIAKFFRSYVKHRTRDIVFYDAHDDESIEVYVNTLSILHKSANDRETLVEYFQEADEEPRHENYFLGTFYQSSEREALCFTDHQAYIQNLAEPILLGKKWTILDGYGPSSAFTFDTATQNDGMHMIGPPMKTQITKLFHHMCHSNNNKRTSARGTIVGK